MAFVVVGSIGLEIAQTFDFRQGGEEEGPPLLALPSIHRYEAIYMGDDGSKEHRRDVPEEEEEDGRHEIAMMDLRDQNSAHEKEHSSKGAFYGGDSTTPPGWPGPPSLLWLGLWVNLPASLARKSNLRVRKRGLWGRIPPPRAVVR